jgi:signal transduction histidine kinase
MVLSISDSGIGIPDEMVKRVFEKFTPSGRTGTRGEKSTGLGLYITKQIVELHGGSISIASQENEGTTVEVTVPRH